MTSHSWAVADNVQPEEQNTTEGYVYCLYCLCPLTSADDPSECPLTR